MHAAMTAFYLMTGGVLLVVLFKACCNMYLENTNKI